MKNLKKAPLKMKSLSAASLEELHGGAQKIVHGWVECSNCHASVPMFTGGDPSQQPYLRCPNCGKLLQEAYFPPAIA